MSLKRTLMSVVVGATVASAVSATALAATPTVPASVVAQGATAATSSPRASLRLDVGHGKAWVGQALPITVTAYFRHVDGVSLEGAPQIASSGLFTSELSREPRQGTEVINGEPTLVATWTGTMTPVTAASLDVTVQLPVHLRYRDAAPRVEMQDPFGQDAIGQDAFDALAANPFDTSVFNRVFNRALRQEVPGRLHEEAVSLRASARPFDVLQLPTADQPAAFTGAIGRFDVKSSLSSPRAAVSEPVTLRMVVEGDGDLDRVELAGVVTSEDWKAYPPKSSTEAAAKGRRARKIFEQVLVPLRGGTLIVPPVSLSAFDPTAGRYVTRDTAPQSVVVDGTALASTARSEGPSTEASTAAVTPPSGRSAEPPSAPRTARVTTVVPWLSPVLLLVGGALVAARVGRTRAARSLRRKMRTAATKGDVVPFYSAAHDLIERRLAKRWGLNPQDVSAALIRDHLGSMGDTLADAIIADDALRFGRAHLEQPDLVRVCASIEQSLGAAS